MKKIVVLLLALVATLTLSACGGGGNSKADVEALKTSVATIQTNLETFEYEKFSLKYEKNNDIEWRQVELDYDPSGYFHSSEFLEEKVVPYGEKEKYSKESYIWIEGSKLTKSYYYRNLITNAAPTKQYWVEEFSSHEEALEEFNEILSDNYISEINFLERDPSIYVIIKNGGHIERMNDYLQCFLEGDERITVTINSHKDLSFDFNLTFIDSTFAMKAENGIITSYTEDDKAVNNKETFTLSLDWTFEEPDLSTYYDFSY